MRRYISEEDSFLIDDNGYKYTLKKKPDLENFVVLAKRNREVKKGSSIFCLIFGIITLPVLIGLLFIVLAISDISERSNNNECQYECVYFNPDKGTIVFQTIYKEIWYEFDPKMIRGIKPMGEDERSDIVIELGNDEQDCVHLDIGYLKKEEKESFNNKLEQIKKGTYVPMI